MGINNLEKDVRIVNQLGLHARPAAKIVKICSKAQGRVWVSKADERVDAANLLDLLTLCCPKGTKIAIRIDNPKDMDILNDLCALVERGFGE